MPKVVTSNTIMMQYYIYSDCYNNNFIYLHPTFSFCTGDAYEEFKRKYYSECVKYLSLCPLIPYLVQEGLLTNDENEKLTNPQYSETEKIQYLLSSVLGKKGPDVVQCFKRCIARETQHKGHVHLTTLFHSCDIRPCDCY